MAGWFATNLVETLLKPAFLRVHKLLRTDLAGQTSAKVRGKWSETDTGQWPARDNLTITMGMTSAEKAQRIGALAQVISQQAQIIQMGGSGILTDNAKVYNAMCDWLRANDLDTPEQYLIDPTSQEAQQAQQTMAQREQEQAAKMEAMQRQLLEMQHAFELEKQSNDIRYKVWSDQLDAEVKEAQITADNVVKIKQLNQGARNADVDA